MGIGIPESIITQAVAENPALLASQPIDRRSLAAIDEEIASLEQELAALPSATQQATQPAQGFAFQPPQAPGLPGAEILQNPLLRAIQDDVTRRVFANQASRGRLGAGETAVALQTALAPTALNLGLTLQGREQAQQQQNIQNLMNLFGIGANVSAGQGSLGLQGASGIGSALQAGGLAQAQGALGQGAATSGALGDIAGTIGFFGPQRFGGFGGPGGASGLGGGLFGTPFQPTTSSAFIA